MITAEFVQEKGGTVIFAPLTLVLWLVERHGRKGNTLYMLDVIQTPDRGFDEVDWPYERIYSFGPYGDVQKVVFQYDDAIWTAKILGNLTSDHMGRLFLGNISVKESVIAAGIPDEVSPDELEWIVKPTTKGYRRLDELPEVMELVPVLLNQPVSGEVATLINCYLSFGPLEKERFVRMAEEGDGPRLPLLIKIFPGSRVWGDN